MPKLQQKDIDDLVQEMNDFYQPKSGECVATPRQMDLLLKRLEAYTDEVQQKAQQEGLDDDKNVLQWSNDMSHWVERLATYQSRVASVPPDQWSTPEGCRAIYKTVTAPLLDGIWYTPMPGISFNQAELDRMASGKGYPPPGTGGGPPNAPEGHSNAKPNDVITPFTLGNQVLAYQDHQKARARQFWSDLYDSAKNFVKKTVEGAEKLAKGVNRGLGIGGKLFVVAAVAGAGYGIYRIVKARRDKSE